MSKLPSSPPAPGQHLWQSLLSIARQAHRDLESLSGKDCQLGVHRLRVRMKKLHALLPLMAECVTPEVLKSLANLVHSIKAGIGQQRDRAVVRALLGELRQDGIAIAKLPKAPPREALKLALPVSALRKFLRSLTQGLKNLNLDALTRKQIRAVYRDNLACAQRFLKRCQDRPSAKRMHRWRTPVKDYYYQSLFLRQARRPCQLAHHLGRALGKLHDYVLLKEICQADPSDELKQAIKERQQKLRQRAFRKARRLFAKR